MKRGKDEQSPVPPLPPGTLPVATPPTPPTQTPTTEPPQKYRRVAPKPSEEFENVGATTATPEVKQENFGIRPSTVPISPYLGPFGNFQPLPSVQTPPPPPSIQTPSPAAQPNRNREVKFENALDFLDQVKLVFAKQPNVYNQFLEIMKEFKTQSIDTPGVIARVSELFKGHRNLILGFNTFLPAGYKIEYEEPTSPTPASLPTPSPKTTTPLPTTIPVTAAPSATVPPLTQPVGIPLAGPTPVVPSGIAQQQQLPRKQPELDHARNYVKKIKLRFAHQPHIYKAFLEILHAYHREHHTIKDVYDQVATLFHNHSDLLEEFTQFLPEPTQSAPVVPIQPPRPAKQRGRTKLSKREEKLKERENKEREHAAAKELREKEKEASRESKEAKEKEPKDRSEKDKEKSSKRAKKSEEIRRHEENLHGAYEDYSFFYRIKQKINNPDIYNEFLKCLNLYSLEIFTKLDLVLMVRDLFGRRFPGLFEQFKQFIHFNEPLADLPKQLPTPPSHWMEIDFSTCKRYGPSYRALPKNYPQPICSGRSELAKSVLNDTWVSVPTGSEDFSFKNSRKNQFEEVLFKCEDDRFELDLVIELNASAMRALEQINKKLQSVKKEDASKVKIEPLDVLHAKSIERLYGDRRRDIMEGLYNNPVVAVPVILKRLKQKDQEWRKAKRDWNKIWREINEKNYHKSLDHQSFYFKQLEKKNLSPKVLIAEIKQKYQEKLKSKTGPAHHLVYTMNDQAIFKEASDLLTFVAERTLSRVDREKLDTFLQHFVQLFFLSKEESEDSEAEDAEEDEEMDEEEKQKRQSAKAEANKAEEKKEVAQTGDDKMEVEQSTAVEANKNQSSTEEKNTQKTKTKSDEKTSDLRLFFGNNTFYIFFRLYQILYDRLSKAKEMAKNSQREEGDRPSVQVLLGKAKSKTQNGEKEDLFQTFLKNVRSLLSGELEQSKFEDDCRETFGISSYPLFTLDKLISQLSKQLQTLLTDDTCAKLLNIYAHHEDGSQNRLFLESIYHANVLEILSEERCYRFEFDRSTGQFTVQLLDSSHQPKFAELSFSKDKWKEYVANYVSSESDLDVRQHHVFLLRNKKSNVTSQVLENTDVSNGLECKICLTTYRLFYVQGTEDYFYRQGKLSSAKQQHETENPKRVVKLYKWLASKGCQTPPLPEIPKPVRAAPAEPKESDEAKEATPATDATPMTTETTNTSTSGENADVNGTNNAAATTVVPPEPSAAAANPTV